MTVEEHAADVVTRQALDAGAAVGEGRAAPGAGLGGFLDGVELGVSTKSKIGNVDYLSSLDLKLDLRRLILFYADA